MSIETIIPTISDLVNLPNPTNLINEDVKSESIEKLFDNLNLNKIKDKDIESNVSDQNISNNKTRSFECCYCVNLSGSKSGSESICKTFVPHGLTKCSKYIHLKSKISKTNYLLIKKYELRKSEEAGFCASGIIPYTYNKGKIYLLVLDEMRYGIRGLNFIGGKRECVKKGKFTRPETSFETALTELDEELGEILLPECKEEFVNFIKKVKIPKFCFWTGKSKMSLYGIKVPNLFMSKLILNNFDKNNCEAQGFKWIKLDDYIGPDSNKEIPGKINFHSYTKDMLFDMKKLCKENDIYTLFNII